MAARRRSSIIVSANAKEEIKGRRRSSVEIRNDESEPLISLDAGNPKNVRVILEIIRRIKEFKELRVHMNKLKEKPAPNIFDFSFFDKPVVKDFSIEVMDYWGELRNKAVVVLQNQIRLWLFARRRNKTSKLYEETILKSIVVCQAAIRRSLIAENFSQKMADKEKMDISFDKFCYDLQKGIKLEMFSRKYGTLQSRSFKLDNERRRLLYDTSQISSRPIDIRKIYKISKNLSGYRYAVVSKYPARCFSLHMKGGRAIDLQADSINQFTELVTGFNRLITFMDSESPFYLDEHGVPRRAGPSIINYAIRRHEKRIQTRLTGTAGAPNNIVHVLGHLHSSITSGGHESMMARQKETSTSQFFNVYSVADDMRFRGALVALATEYDHWAVEGVKQVQEPESKSNQGNSTVDWLKRAHTDRESKQSLKSQDDDGSVNENRRQGGTSGYRMQLVSDQDESSDSQEEGDEDEYYLNGYKNNNENTGASNRSPNLNEPNENGNMNKIIHRKSSDAVNMLLGMDDD